MLAIAGQTAVPNSLIFFKSFIFKSPCFFKIQFFSNFHGQRWSLQLVIIIITFC